jgi:hypothetical protein
LKAFTQDPVYLLARCVVRYLEFEGIPWKGIGPYGRKLRYLITAERSLFFETGSFGKASFAPPLLTTRYLDEAKGLHWEVANGREGCR